MKACLGLRLQLEDRTNAITVPTHGFVFLTQSNYLVRKLSFCYHHIKPVMARCDLEALTGGKPAIAGDNLALGKKVCLCNSNQEVGIIHRTFDSPSRTLPYPAGFPHDLSLVTGPDLPAMNAPRGMPLLTGLALPQDVLDGRVVFVGQVLPTGRCDSHAGHVANATREALIVGHEYIWDVYGIRQAFVWRLANYTSMGGFSGAVLAAGKPTDSTARAVCSQNFEALQQTWPSEHLPIHQWGDCGTFWGQSGWGPRHLSCNGGYWLPDDIYKSTIVMQRVDDL
ncbi:hypothetical protein EJ06DRAFT_170613 [Trichodelitschia bisporula]|uniref:Uncharacterized protein n=1 Tax=Trichodelitschia bisporula TaxID=703511 RepID=A0A6G1HLN0_9PEZI|nr:hypothetical protein EJ06DRAFT_170613 [Trichodelitschia bisporula]